MAKGKIPPGGVSHVPNTGSASDADFVDAGSLGPNDPETRFMRMFEVADIIASLDAPRVRHYVTRVVESPDGGESENEAVGRIDDMPNDVPTGHDLGTRFRRRGIYKVVTEIRWTNKEGKSERLLKSTPRMRIGEEYERLVDVPATSPASSPATGISPTVGGLDMAFSLLDKFTDVAVKLRGDVAPPLAPDVAAMQAAYDRLEKDTARRVARMQEDFDAQVERIKKQAGAVPVDKPDLKPSDIEGYIDVAGKAAGFVKDLFADPAPGATA